MSDPDSKMTAERRALRRLLDAVQPFRAFRDASDALIASVAESQVKPGDESAKLARLEQMARHAEGVLS